MQFSSRPTETTEGAVSLQGKQIVSGHWLFCLSHSFCCTGQRKNAPSGLAQTRRLVRTGSCPRTKVHQPLPRHSSPPPSTQLAGEPKILQSIGAAFCWPLIRRACDCARARVRLSVRVCVSACRRVGVKCVVSWGLVRRTETETQRHGKRGTCVQCANVGRAPSPVPLF